MKEERAAFRRILASTSILGGATALTVLIGLIRTKLLALIIGPLGIGLIGILTSVMTTAGSIGGMGLNYSGVRELAADEKERAGARRAVWLATWPLALVSALVVWFFRTPIAELASGSAEHADAVGLVSVGVVLTIVAASQGVVILGYRRTGQYARSRIYGAVLSLLIAVPAVYYLGSLGIVIAVLAVPLGNVIASIPFLPARSGRASRGERTVLGHWRLLFGTGLVAMITTTLGSLMLVLVRAIIVREDGLTAAGLYQAAYTISAINLSLVLTAMGADYLPRLAALGDDRAAANQLVNQQLRTILSLLAPVLVAVAALAPVALQILYSGAFVGASEMLRIQLAGELIKLPCWALAFLLLARRDNSMFLFGECLFIVLYLVGAYVLYPAAGLTGAGMAYLGAYCVAGLVLYWICRAKHDVRIDGANLKLLLATFAVLAGIFAASRISAAGSAILGLGCAVVLAGYALRTFGAIPGRGERTEPPALQIIDEESRPI